MKIQSFKKIHYAQHVENKKRLLFSGECNANMQILFGTRQRLGNRIKHYLADNVNQFKNRLDKHWKMHDIVFNYRADFAETGGLA